MEMQELKNEIQKTHEEFKSYVDREFAEIKKNGVAAPETQEAIERMNKQLDELQAKMSRPVPAERTEETKGDKGLAIYMRKGWSGLTQQPELLTKAMTVGSDESGGYHVMPENGGILATKLFETTPMRRIASVVSISTDAYEGLIDNDEASSGWVAETGARTQSNTPTIDKQRIPTHEIYAMPAISQKLLDDANFGVEAWLDGKVADKFSREQNEAFVVGNGITQPRGFTAMPVAETADATRAWGTLEFVKSGANGDFAASNPADKLYDLIHALKPGYRMGASFVAPRAVVNKIRKFKDASSAANYLWQPGIQEGQPSRLLGYPVVEAEDMPALATNSLSLAFGNFRTGYLIVERLGVRVLRDPFTAKPYILFYTTARVGGDVINTEAIKLMKFAS
jgi:HK97 family phage major capsid protein